MCSVPAAGTTQLPFLECLPEPLHKLPHLAEAESSLPLTPAPLPQLLPFLSLTFSAPLSPLSGLLFPHKKTEISFDGAKHFTITLLSLCSRTV